MTKPRINLRSVALIIACLTVSMMLFTNCNKDDNDDGGANGDNPFVGTWLSDNGNGSTITFTANTWAMTLNDEPFLHGDYTRNGNTATLTGEGLIWPGEVEAATAVVSGKKLILTVVDDTSQTYTKI